jgi:hypothetical protein
MLRFLGKLNIRGAMVHFLSFIFSSTVASWAHANITEQSRVVFLSIINEASSHYSNEFC